MTMTTLEDNMIEIEEKLEEFALKRVSLDEEALVILKELAFTEECKGRKELCAMEAIGLNGKIESRRSALLAQEEELLVELTRLTKEFLDEEIENKRTWAAMLSWANVD
jgi:hypothetical protein